MSFTIGSLFSGSGGFELAATMCGGTPVWASEIEPYPIAVTRSRFPNMKHLGSVTDINGGEVEPVDIISFGSPCQDLSVAGKRAGLKHEDNGDDETTRSGLFMEAVRIIKEMRKVTNGVYPRFAIWENVPGAFSSNKGEDFRTVLEELIKIVEPSAVMPPVPKNGWSYADSYCGEGWSLAYRVFDAQYWGVPQRRRRIYLVLDLGGECAGEVLFEREGLRGYFAESRTPWQGIAADAENCLGADDRAGEIAGGADSGGTIPNPENLRGTGAYGSGWDDRCVPAGRGGGRGTVGFQWQAGAEASLCIGDELGPSLSCTRVPAVMEAVGFDMYNQQPTGEVSRTLKTPVGGDDLPVVFAPIPIHDQATRFSGKRGDKSDGKGNGLGIGNPGDHMNTLTGGDRHAVAFQTYQNVVGALCSTDYKWVQQQQVEQDKLIVEQHNIRYIVRRLTPIECARLQGFADRWAVPDRKDDFTDEEYRFWLDVRNTHAAINGKTVKEYPKAQMLKWYNGLYTDSSSYKLWGNGIALPNALYVMQGIADAINQ